MIISFVKDLDDTFNCKRLIWCLLHIIIYLIDIGQSICLFKSIKKIKKTILLNTYISLFNLYGISIDFQDDSKFKYNIAQRLRIDPAIQWFTFLPENTCYIFPRIHLLVWNRSVMKYKREVRVSDKDKNSKWSKIIFSLNDDISGIKSCIGINKITFWRARFHVSNDCWFVDQKLLSSEL